jgi:hypothetical protein
MPVYVTHCDKNYAVRAAALVTSMRQNGSADLVCVVCHDEEAKTIVDSLNDSKLLSFMLSEVEAYFPDLKIAQANRSKLEYLFCLTPYLIEYTFLLHDNEIVIYVDSDIYFFDSPTKALNSLCRDTDVAIVPHRFTEDSKYREIYGKFNVGWMAFRPTDESRKVLNWWREKCFESTSCVVTDNSFADQKYLDQFTTISTRISIANNLGENAAPWNCYSIDRIVDGRITISNDELIYFHFSGLRMYPNCTVLGYAGYGKRPSHGMRSSIYRPYIKNLKRIEYSLDFKPAQETRSLMFREWIRALYFFDIIFNKPQAISKILGRHSKTH